MQSNNEEKETPGHPLLGRSAVNLLSDMEAQPEIHSAADNFQFISPQSNAGVAEFTEINSDATDLSQNQEGFLTPARQRKKITHSELIGANDIEDLQSGPDKKNWTRKNTAYPANQSYVPLSRAESERSFFALPADQSPVPLFANGSYTVDEHLIPIGVLCDRYDTNIDESKPARSLGLSSSTADQKLSDYGFNSLIPPRRKMIVLKYLECLASIFNIMLLIAGILMAILSVSNQYNSSYYFYVGCILVVVAFLNAFIELYQTQKSESIMDSFLDIMPLKCNVMRSGTARSVFIRDLVPGDVIYLQPGDRVPADIRLFYVSNFLVCNSTLNGEPNPVERKVKTSTKNPLNAENLVFSGTEIVSGHAFGIVFRTGSKTVLGLVAKLVAQPKRVKSNLSIEVERFCNVIMFFTGIIGASFLIFAIATQRSSTVVLTFIVGIMVAFVPQGLSSIISMHQAIAAQRLIEAGVMIKEIDAIETLGAVSLLAVDKAGTLTQNTMQVCRVWVNGISYIVSEANIMTPGAMTEEDIDAEQPEISQILKISAITANVSQQKPTVSSPGKQHPSSKTIVKGNAAEKGLFNFASDHWTEFPNMRYSTYPKVLDVPFKHSTRFQVSVHQELHSNGCYTLYMKGSPEIILMKCKKVSLNGIVQNISSSYIQEFNQAVEQYSERGLRVIAFAKLPFPSSTHPEGFTFRKDLKNVPFQQMILLGIVAMDDPPKPGVLEAVSRCRLSGVKVLMMTEDNTRTAEAIARKIDIISYDTKESIVRYSGRGLDEITESEAKATVIDADTLDLLSDKEWSDIFAKDEIVFSHTSPEKKAMIIKRAQMNGHVVAATGSGLNDAAALKIADLGIAMNESAVSITKDAASIILLKDNFSAIVHGIEEGRLVFSNLKKAIRHTLTHSLAEIIPFLFYVVLPIPQAISFIQILVIDLGFELLAAISFAWEPPASQEQLLRSEPSQKPGIRPELSSPMITKRKRPLINSKSAQALSLIEVADGAQMEMLQLDDAVTSPLTKKDFDTITVWESVAESVKQIFSTKYWKNFFRIFRHDSRYLIDSEMLCWAYLQGGVIEAAGALVTFFCVLQGNGVTIQMLISAASYNGSGAPYFTPFGPSLTLTSGSVLTAAGLMDLLAQAQSSYYLSILIIQMWNLFACKSSPWKNRNAKNPKTWYAVIAGLFFGYLVVYVPFLNPIFLTSWNLDPTYLIIPLLFGVLIYTVAVLINYLRLRSSTAIINDSREVRAGANNQFYTELLL